TEGFQDDSGAVVTEARLINYVGWPFSRNLSATQVADGFGVTRYVKIPWNREDVQDQSDPWAGAEASSNTRHLVVREGFRDLDGKPVPKPVALIAMGGQLGGFSGFLPGVAEEIAMA